jgi:hypothetical protein
VDRRRGTHGTENAIRILATFTSWFMCHLCKCGRLSCEPPLLNSFTLVPCTSKPKQHEHTLCWVLPVLLVVTQTFLQPQTIYIFFLRRKPQTIFSKEVSEFVCSSCHAMAAVRISDEAVSCARRVTAAANYSALAHKASTVQYSICLHTKRFFLGNVTRPSTAAHGSRRAASASWLAC